MTWQIGTLDRIRGRGGRDTFKTESLQSVALLPVLVRRADMCRTKRSPMETWGALNKRNECCSYDGVLQSSLKM